MPTVINDLHKRLSEALRDVADLLPQVRALLPEPDGSGPQTSTIGRHAPESREPWNQPAADAYWNLYFGPGKLLPGVRYELGLRRVLDQNLPVGDEALDVLGRILGGAPDDVIKRIIRKLERWVTLAERIPDVGTSEPWVVIRSPTGRSPECPYCHTFGLRMQLQAEQVKCVFPGCCDIDGMPTRAYVRRGRMTGEPHLVFRDGTVMGWVDGECE